MTEMPNVLSECPHCRKGADLLARVADRLWAGCSSCRTKWRVPDQTIRKMRNTFARSLVNYQTVGT